ncbi:MAG: hypothetical protein WBG30_00875 [Psychrilyobacter sp.]|uniref:hypothetical protein n=1 Tax=Psychrilyobacter sp. TaxID=2586924 RepID=UPI003C76A2AE
MENFIQKLKKEGIKCKKENQGEKWYLHSDTKPAFGSLKIEMIDDNLRILPTFKKIDANNDIQNKQQTFSIQNLKENGKEWNSFINVLRTYTVLQS